MPARDATEDELLRVHTARHVEALGQSAGKSGYYDADTYFCAESSAAARRAAGAAAVLIETLTSEQRFAAALVRPPGHHARPDAAMGFCLFNNVAVAAAKARASDRRRVMIVDFDVHHGNGTQEIFYDDPSILYVSLHQFPFYPGTGAADEVGRGEGRGFTVNVPLSAGADDAVYQAAFSRLIAPITEQYSPDLLLLSAGFDAHARDPLAEMNLSENGYACMVSSLLGAIAKDVPVGVLLEGAMTSSASRVRRSERWRPCSEMDRIPFQSRSPRRTRPIWPLPSASSGPTGSFLEAPLAESRAPGVDSRPLLVAPGGEPGHAVALASENMVAVAQW